MGLAAANNVPVLAFSTTLEAGTQATATFTSGGYKFNVRNRDAVNGLWFTFARGNTADAPSAAANNNLFVPVNSSVDVDMSALGMGTTGNFTVNLAGTTNPITITKLA